MTSERLETLKEIFHATRDLHPSERDAFLAQTCRSDEQLLREIEALLRSHEAAEDFIAAPPAQLAAEVFGHTEERSDAGKTIGRYKLIERIGTGGMGVVYLARRDDQQFEMQVAIKLIKRGMDTEFVLRRFHHERQILASLEHSNIARLLDGGTTDDGLPYFVMEYIQGERIDRYASERQLSVEDRLQLFREVCAAVSYAHQRLVVHRDLKPSNILVTSAGVPKLLDFGIAKIVTPDGHTEAFATMTVAPIMTPEYASPEQIEGAPATTLSDVYSLGAVLYELLSGRPPYQTKSRSPQEIARVRTGEELPRPSTVVGDQPSAIRDQQSLRGDLDNIVLMAMQSDSDRRYRSVEQFSEDIRRHLIGLPVIARRDTWSYRAQKFVRRNRIALSAAALVLLCLIGGVLTTAWQAHKATIQEQRARAEQARAERRFNDVRQLAHSLLFDYHDAIRNLPGATKVRERLAKDALAYLDKLAADARGDRALQRELASGYDRVGDARGGKVSGSMGDLGGAQESYAKALRIREGLVAADPHDAQARRDLANSHQRVGYSLLTTAEASSGLAHLRKALELYLVLAREQPLDQDLQFDLADTHNKLGSALKGRGDLAGALEQYRAAQAIREGLVAGNPQDRLFHRALWSSRENMASLLRSQGDLVGAIEANREAAVLGEALVAEDPLNTNYLQGLVRNYRSAGEYRSGSDKPAALEYFRKAAALDEELLAKEPSDAITREDLAVTYKKMADLLANLGENSQGLAHFSKALELSEKLVADAPADLSLKFAVATNHAGVAGMRARLGETDLAMQECDKAVALLGAITEDATNAGQRLKRAQAREYLGYAYLALASSPKAAADEKRQNLGEARAMFRETLDILDELRRQDKLDAGNEEWAKGIAGEFAKTDAALAK